MKTTKFVQHHVGSCYIWLHLAGTRQPLEHLEAGPAWPGPSWPARRRSSVCLSPRLNVAMRRAYTRARTGSVSRARNVSGTTKHTLYVHAHARTHTNKQTHTHHPETHCRKVNTVQSLQARMLLLLQPQPQPPRKRGVFTCFVCASNSII